MADAASTQRIETFFLTHGLTENDRLECDAVAQGLHQNEHIVPALSQGCCSYTVLVGDRQIIQFRPQKYQLDIPVMEAVKKVFSNYAPLTKLEVDAKVPRLLMYTMERLQGISYDSYRGIEMGLGSEQAWSNHIRLIEDFAVFLAKSWHHDADLPSRSKVGSSIAARLYRLTQELPHRFRSEAVSVLEQLHKLDVLPWVLTHGDVIPSNIMVDPSTGHLTGFVDWAEAEVLPFGMCLYGLEELLGSMTVTGWTYRDRSEWLRSRFWQRLLVEIPDLDGDVEMLDAVTVARDVGVLLWHGFAWDDGAINRVVEDGRDEEIRRLDAFLVSRRSSSKPRI